MAAAGRHAAHCLPTGIVVSSSNGSRAVMHAAVRGRLVSWRRTVVCQSHGQAGDAAIIPVHLPESRMVSDWAVSRSAAAAAAASSRFFHQGAMQTEPVGPVVSSH